MNDELRRTILARRRAFIAAALVGSASCAVACAEPQVCLEPVYNGCNESPRTYSITASGDVCVGRNVALTAHASSCGGADDLSEKVVFATSDPAVLIIENNTARGVAVGKATVAALVDGIPRGTMVLAVTECATDAGSDSATDAPTD